MVEFATNLTRRTFSWQAWKEKLVRKGGAHQCDETSEQYFVWFYDGHEVLVTTIWKVAVPQDIIDGGLTQEQSDEDKEDFETSFLPSANGALVPKTADGKVRMAQEKTDGERVNFFSHDFTDPTTWYAQSTRVVAEVASDSGDHTTYELAERPVVDIYHGKVTQEDTLRDASNNSYRVVVTVTPSGQSAQVKTEQDPHFGTGGDFVVDYDLGTVTFLSALNPTDEVKVTYHWVNLDLNNGTASRFTVAPAAGKTLSLEIAECQFSTDVEPNDTVVFEVWGYADAFLPPATMAALGIPAGIGYKIKLTQLKYKTLGDFQNDAFRVYPAYAAMGSQNNWRSQKQPVTVFDWDYLTSVMLKSSAGMEIRVFLEHDAPFGGWTGVATFYCKSEVER